jgi:NAD-dependent SIR2 family protein deacetylase
MVDATPSYGHLVLAALFRIGKANVVWTTNFDHLVETATSRLFETTARLTVADLERHEVAQRALGGC